MSIIKVENLSKKFIISHESKERYTALRDVLSRSVKKIFSFPKYLRSDGSLPYNKEEFWALKDINFEINQGDRVGIIGRNGAGKSTLLKILSRITPPSEGKVTIKGRVASLLEVGTGFHQELTGRENIYLNGAILGMSRADIKRKFDEIVAFAEVEQFLDTPVKRYSSGMYVRLAFAVAAHLEPEILIVDEVLAVGDAQFQKKCLGKMEEVSKNEGRTVLFVSHNISAIKGLCSSGIFLHKGQKILQGNVIDTLKKYLSFDQEQLNNQTKYKREKTPTGKNVFIQEVEMIDDQSLNYFCLQLNLLIQSNLQIRVGINLKLKDEMGFPVGFGCTHYSRPELRLNGNAVTQVRIKTEKLSLAIGKYNIGIEMVMPGAEYLDAIDDCIQFELTNDGITNRNYGISQSWGYGTTEIKFEKISSF